MKKIYDFPDFNPEKLHPLNIDRLAVGKIPSGSLVLDIGCATGFMGKYLIENKSCKVYGVEVDKVQAEIAEKNLSGVLTGSVEETESIKKINKMTKNKKFDVILATSLIEHLTDPDQFLKVMRNLLKPQGIIIISTPNIAHFSTRTSLLRGKFDYTEYGILDRTHLHFYTINTFKKIFKENGYRILEFLIDPVGGGYPKISKILSKFSQGLFAYQMLIVANKK